MQILAVVARPGRIPGVMDIERPAKGEDWTAGQNAVIVAANFIMLRQLRAEEKVNKRQRYRECPRKSVGHGSPSKANS